MIERSLDIMRLRRFKSLYLEIADTGGVGHFLRQVSTLIKYPEKREDIVDGWASGQQAQINRVYELLKRSGQTYAHIEAPSMMYGGLKTMMAYEGLLQAADGRRDAVIREIERHRSMKEKAQAIEVGYKKVSGAPA